MISAFLFPGLPIQSVLISYEALKDEKTSLFSSNFGSEIVTEGLKRLKDMLRKSVLFITIVVALSSCAQKIVPGDSSNSSNTPATSYNSNNAKTEIGVVSPSQGTPANNTLSTQPAGNNTKSFDVKK